MRTNLEIALEELMLYLSSEISERFQSEAAYVHLNEKYLLLSESEKEQFFVILKDACQSKMLFGVLMALFDHKPSSLLMKYISGCIIQGEFPLAELVAIEEQLRLFYFLNQFLDRIYIRQIHDYIVERAERELVYDDEFVRNSGRIIIMTKQLLGERHATTRIMVNLYQFLIELGYEVRIVVTNTNKFTPDISYWSVGAYQKVNSLYEEDTAFCINYYGIDVYGYYMVSSKADIAKETIKCIEMIRGFKPMMIFNCDGFNYIADILDKHFPVACMGFTKELPTTAGRYIIRYFNDGLAHSDEYKQQLTPRQILYPCIFYSYYTYTGKQRDYVNKMIDSGWKIAIVGNRLDQEVSEEFQHVLCDLLESMNELTYVFIGDCPKLEKKYSFDPLHYNFIGYVEDLRGALSECKLFINPPRIGGSGGALLALAEGVPVITLPDCDTASVCGQDYVIGSLGDLIEKVKMYYSDNEYRSKMAKRARERHDEIVIKPNVSKQNISTCIKSILDDYECHK